MNAINRYLAGYLVGLLVFLNIHTGVVADESRALVLATGVTEQVRLSSIDEQKTIFLDPESTIKTFEHEQVVRWGSLSERELTDQIGLVDGSILVGQVLKISRTQVVVETDVWGELTLPIDIVSNVIWKLPTDTNRRARFRDAMQIQPTTRSEEATRNSARRKVRDKVRLTNGDFLRGRLLTADSRFLTFQTDSGDVELRRDLVASWSRADQGTPNGHVIGFRDGTKLVVARVRMEQRFEVNLMCGVHLGALLEVRPIEEGLICYFRINNPNVRYLSDIKPLGHKHISFLTTSWSWGRDRNVLGGPITSRNRVFAKGIGMHSTARLAFDLPEGFDEFHSELAIDRSAQKAGSVAFRVFASSEGVKWNTVHKSQIIRGGEALVPVRVDIRGAKRLALVVDFAERGDVLDRANWIGARLIRNPQ